MNLKTAFANNPGILLSRTSVRGLLCDYFSNDMKKINAMLVLYDEGIISNIDKIRNDSLARNCFLDRIAVNHSMDRKAAADGLRVWCDSIDAGIIAIMKEAEKNDSADKDANKSDPADSQDSDDSEESEPPDTSSLLLKTDSDTYYINPKPKLYKDRVYIPCGFGKTDNGFFICGIKKSELCRHPMANVFALVYNYLTRNSCMDKRDIPAFFHNDSRLYDVDYKAVFRLSMAILQLLRHNYITGNTVSIKYDGTATELSDALLLINRYLALFCRLMGIEEYSLEAKNAVNGIPVSVTSEKGIYIADNNKPVSNARELWYGKKINYRLGGRNLNDLLLILKEISDFDSFREGQFETLCKMLSADSNTVCIMPTGSGKSLIYYLISLLQPLPLIVVSPTDILIEDQIRNLRIFHRMDNASHLVMKDTDSFYCYEMTNSLNYITPVSMHNRNLLTAFRHINNGEIQRKEGMLVRKRFSSRSLLSYVILDEIHSISNWGHDFRPEYLMLSKNLGRYLGEVTYLGFTATANYTVVSDIQKQLDIPDENILSPVPLGKSNISYNFMPVSSTEIMYDRLRDIIAPILSRKERTIVFTKNRAIADRVADVIGSEAAVFTAGNTKAYRQFADFRCSVLVAVEDLGVGINLPSVRNIIHFGLPLSKAEYVQEIGRAGRAYEAVTSYVIYPDKSMAPAGLLSRDTPANDIPALLSGLKNDYADVFSQLTAGCPSYNDLSLKIAGMYDRFDKGKKISSLEHSAAFTERGLKRILYILYVTGFVNDWYAYSRSGDDNGIDFLVDINSVNPGNPSFRMPDRMKERLTAYFTDVNAGREWISKVERSDSEMSIFSIYAEWFYSVFLYRQKEQFLDMFDLVESGADDCGITENIKDYFSLPFIELKSNDRRFNSMSVPEIGDYILKDFKPGLLADIERLNSNNYSYKLDFFLFSANLKLNGIYDCPRFKRFYAYMNSDEKQSLSAFYPKLYSECVIPGRIALVNAVSSGESAFAGSLSDFWEAAFADKPRDLVFWGFSSLVLNECFNRIKEVKND